ncbi:MAG: ATP-binding protein [Oscillospiraceae bacterium]|nr:ATP-binding protein [Oscillospiraceae bacterium]
MNIQSETLGALFEMSRDAVLGIMDGRITFVNKAAEAYLGLHTGDPARLALPDHILSDPSERFIASLELNGRPADVTITRQDGFTLVCAVFQEEGHAVPQFPLPSEDLRATLMTAKLAIDAIVTQTGADESLQLQDYTSILYHSYYRMKRLCDHLAAAGSIQQERLPSNPQMEDLKELCRDLCDTVQLLIGNGIALSFRAGQESYLTLLDADQIEIMLLNLISNSIAHMPSGGIIEIALSRRGERFVLSIRDNGTGIDPAKLSGTAPKDLSDTATGSGLGLYVAKGIARRHGGTLILDTTPGQGASVRVSLPHRVSDTLRSPTIVYHNKGMTNILTELSTVLDRNSYGKKVLE